MHHIEGCERDQSQLLPARVDDSVHAENPVRFIDAFADGLDLGKAGFARVDPKMTGRPGYDPVDLLKLYIYGRGRCSMVVAGRSAYRSSAVLQVWPAPRLVAGKHVILDSR